MDKLTELIEREFDGEAFLFMEHFYGELEELFETGSVEIDGKGAKFTISLKID